MKKILLILLLPFYIYSLELKVASYNVENLFDDVDNGSEYDDYRLNKHNWTKTIYKKKLRNITKVICDLNADVLALQEIENKNSLNNLLKSLNRVGCKYRYSAITHKSGSSIQVALISKVKIKKFKELIVSSNKRDRNILKVTLDTNPKLIIYVNHWRSKRAKESFRVRYAKRLIQDIKSLPNGSEYIILGDFNSKYNECEDFNKKYNDTNGICGIDTILKTYYKGKLLRLDNKLNRFYHYNLWSEIVPYKRWSHNFFGHKEAIDSIIIPPTLLDDKGWFYIRKSFRVFKKPYLFLKNDWINQWQYKNGKHLGKGYSDHLPIYAKFSNSKEKEFKHLSFIDRFFSFFIPLKKEKISSNPLDTKEENVDFNKFLSIKELKKPVVLKNACVVFKRLDIAVIKNNYKSNPITLFKCANALKEGYCYDIKVYKKGRYYKKEEILDLDKIRVFNKIDINKYIPKFDIKSLNKYKIGEVVKDAFGIYKDGYFFVNNNKIKIFFKDKNINFIKNQSKIYIKKAQIGYYKGEKELIIYSKEDIEVE